MITQSIAKSVPCAKYERALARALERDVKCVHDDAQTLMEVGLIEKDTEGKLVVPFVRIHAEFDLGKVV